ncbi:ParB/RepB/Spo0J family partition protein [Clostridium saccharoperbutylacetonicum]
MGKFNMFELIGNGSENNEVNREKVTKFKTISIDISNLIPWEEENFYSIDENELKELKDSIEVFGVQQNLVVKKVNNKNVSDSDTKYEIIAGHRRYLALKKLFEEGKTQFQYAPCKVENEEDSVKDKLLLLITNSTARQLTDWEKTKQAEKLRELLIEYKKKEKLPGGVRKIIADILNTSPTQVARMDRISKNLTEDFKQEFKDEKVNISTAYELSKLSQDKQEEILKEYQEKGSIAIKDVKEKIEDLPIQKGYEENNTLVIIDNDIVDTKTGEIVEQIVPEYIAKKVIDRIKEMNIDELANFICDRCNGGSGCSGICGLAIICTNENKYETCIKWLNTQT